MLDSPISRTVRFSTDDLPENDRLPMWREQYARVLLQVDVEPAEHAIFHSTFKARSLPGMHLLSGTLSAARIVRTREFAADGNDDFILAVNQTGPVVVSSRGREVELREGDAVLMNSSDVTAFERPCAGGSFSLRMPRSILASLIVDADAMVMQRIPQLTEALHLLANYSSTLLDDTTLTSTGLRHLVVSHVSDLVALTLGATHDAADLAQDRGLRAARLKTAKAYIVEYSGRRDLSIGSVAAHLGVTPRYLQRLFEIDGGTFSTFLLNQRLTRAHRMLSEPRFDRCAVGAIAYDAGFGDLSYFNRCFRKLFGVTPRDIRDASGKTASFRAL